MTTRNSKLKLVPMLVAQIERLKPNSRGFGHLLYVLSIGLTWRLICSASNRLPSLNVVYKDYCNASTDTLLSLSFWSTNISHWQNRIVFRLFNISGHWKKINRKTEYVKLNTCRTTLLDYSVISTIRGSYGVLDAIFDTEIMWMKREQRWKL